MAELGPADRLSPQTAATFEAGQGFQAAQLAIAGEKRRSSDSAATSSLNRADRSKQTGSGLDNRKLSNDESGKELGAQQLAARTSATAKKTSGWRRGKLDAVKSLESSDGAGSSRSKEAHQQQQKQMFSLKQLALQSRNLSPSGKKRSSLQSDQPQPAKASSSSNTFSRLLFEHSNQVGQSSSLSSSPSQSSAEDSLADTNKRSARKQSTGEQPANQNLERRDSGSALDESDLEAELSSFSDEEEDADELDSEDDDDDEATDNEVSPQAAGAATGQEQDELSKQRQKRRRRRRKRRSKRALPFRQPYCCQCDQVANKIDPDGLPVTDVDLVTYRELCQMEQQVHQMRTSRRRNHQQPALDGSHRASLVFGGTGEPGGLRRSSLQEESGAYYQLCTSNDEQTIRRKYAWYPPSLKQVSLVDEFFAKFAREKIPLVAGFVESSQEGRPAADGQEAGKPSGPRAGRESASLSAGSSGCSQRDEQVSFQLPRQDISLDYCSYFMSEASRAAYRQFIEKRNSGALDVGTVVLVKPFAGQQSPSSSVPASGRCSAETGRPQSRPASRSGARTPLAEQQAGSSQQQQQPQRKLSVALLAASQSQQEQLAGQQASGCSGAQRCRRCLVRFEPRQLAVAAPNFVMGSALYRSSHIPAPLDEGAIGRPDRRTSLERLRIDPAKPAQAGPSGTPTNVALFHPTCFTCSTCKEFLVDLVYCLRDNKLYCLRHYGESLRPRCSWCQEVSFISIAAHQVEPLVCLFSPIGRHAIKLTDCDRPGFRWLSLADPAAAYWLQLPSARRSKQTRSFYGCSHLIDGWI